MGGECPREANRLKDSFSGRFFPLAPQTSELTENLRLSKKYIPSPFSSICLLTGLIGAALLVIRLIANDFRPGTTTADHPYLLFTSLLMGANLLWLLLIPQFKRMTSPMRLLWPMLGVALVFRVLFFGSIPIYEDDWNRYLWDATVILNDIDPYEHAPYDIVTDKKPSEDILALRDIHQKNGEFLYRINNPKLTSIYPPVAQVGFVFAGLIKPLDLNALRVVFLLAELLTILLFLKVLPMYGRSKLWVLVYALNPLLIFSAFNVAHMDILLPPFLLLTLWLIRRHPFLAGLSLTGAAGVKVWPLLLAPLFFRRHLTRPKIYLGVAAMMTVVSLILFYPLLRHLGETSGLQAYSGSWQRSSFLFPLLERFIALFTETPGTPTRLIIGISLFALSLWFGFLSKREDENWLPTQLLYITLALLVLSPTGFPWYLTWVIVFLPFKPLYGVALLCVLTPLYYVRFALGELDIYDIYLYRLIPLQFAVPLLVLGYELVHGRWLKPKPKSEA